MNLELFIARRIYAHGDGKNKATQPAIRIATIGVALGLAVMLVSVCVVMGFKREIRSKVTGLAAHIQLSNFHSGQSYETLPVAAGDSLLEALRQVDGVRHVQRYATKLGIIKTKEQFQGMVFKGVGKEFDPTFLRQHLTEGEIPTFTDSADSRKIVLSRTLADKLRLRLGDAVYTYYLQEDIKARKFTIAGIYETHFSDFDNLFVLGDLYTVRRLNKWLPDQASGIEIELEENRPLDEAAERIGKLVSTHPDRYGNTYFTQTVVELNPQLFAWLDVLDLNVWVILFLMTSVAGFSMVSGLLIIILERTNMIGILKALGGRNASIQKMFLYFSLFIVGKGILWGNIIALALCYVQGQWNWIKLDAADYYIDSVPIYFNLGVWALLNVGTVLLSVLILLGPSFLIAHIKPAQSIRFE